MKLLPGASPAPSPGAFPQPLMMTPTRPFEIRFMGPSPSHAPQGRAAHLSPPERSRGPFQVTRYLLAEVVGSWPECILGWGWGLSLREGSRRMGTTPSPLGRRLRSALPHCLPLQSQAICIHPLYVMLPCTLSSSLAFMLPVATPPNAIAFSFGGLKVTDMVSGRGLQRLSTPCSVFPSWWTTE